MFCHIILFSLKKIIYFTIIFDLHVQTDFAGTIKTSLRMLQRELSSVCLIESYEVSFSQAVGFLVRSSITSGEPCANCYAAKGP